MTAKLTTIKDVDGTTTLYPLTKTNAISDSNGTSLDSLLSAINTAIAGKQGTLTFDNTPTANSSNPVTSGGILAALTGIGSFIIDSSYFDPVDTDGTSGDVQSMNYIKTKKLFNNRSLIIIWGGTPVTDSNGYLTGASSGNGWIPTSSEGVKANLFTKVANCRTFVLPYGGTQYSYGWRVIHYMRDGYVGINVRYGNATGNLRFSYIMIGTEA